MTFKVLINSVDCTKAHYKVIFMVKNWPLLLQPELWSSLSSRHNISWFGLWESNIWWSLTAFAELIMYSFPMLYPMWVFVRLIGDDSTSLKMCLLWYRNNENVCLPFVARIAWNVNCYKRSKIGTFKYHRNAIQNTVQHKWHVLSHNPLYAKQEISQ